jgi:Leucine-rich repeat (LRR) protein
MHEINVSYNELTSLPSLTPSIIWRFFDYIFSNNLTYLNCSNNQLTSLPQLPDTIRHLYCNDNQLTSLPNIPKDLRLFNNYLYSENNKINKLPNDINDLQKFNNKLIPFDEESIYKILNESLEIPKEQEIILKSDLSEGVILENDENTNLLNNIRKRKIN